MEPFKVKELPIEYNIDKELLKLISETNEKYGEYKSYLKNIDFDSCFFSLFSYIYSTILSNFLLLNLNLFFYLFFYRY